MRDGTHYRRMMENNPSAAIGVTLAARAIYAARHGVCEDADCNGEWRDLVRELRAEHGESLAAHTVLVVMSRVQSPTAMTVEEIIEYTRTEREPTLRTGRCVHCSRPKSVHAEDNCPGGNTQYATTSLPEGITCADCVHANRCCAIFGQLPEDESCQFYPVRFHEKRSKQT